MVNKTIIDYDRLPPDYIQKLAKKYCQDKTLIDLPTNDGAIKAIEICYDHRDYVVPLNTRALNILEWDSYQEKESNAKIESFLDIDTFNKVPKNLDDLFYP